MKTLPVDRRVGRGFTLVEMLVVITIIGILAGLAIPAVIIARNRARITAMAMDIKQLEMACQAYKEKFGEYPPDFASSPGFNYYLRASDQWTETASQEIVQRHLAKAFPRYANASSWPAIAQDLDRVGIDVSKLTPRTALAFWLGGIPDPNNSNRPSGFGADPTQPFSLPTADLTGNHSAAPVCASRIGPFFDFDSTRLKTIVSNPIPSGSTSKVLCVQLYWPQGSTVNVTPPSNDNVSGAITYFRAENGLYCLTSTFRGNIVTAVKSQTDTGDPSNPQGVVFPAFDTRTSTTSPTVVINWVNPTSVQIFSAGPDMLFGNVQPPLANTTGLQFPTGENYRPYTYDDVTNFSGGKLEDKIP